MNSLLDFERRKGPAELSRTVDPALHRRKKEKSGRTTLTGVVVLGIRGPRRFGWAVLIGRFGSSLVRTDPMGAASGARRESSNIITSAFSRNIALVGGFMC